MKLTFLFAGMMLLTMQNCLAGNPDSEMEIIDTEDVIIEIEEITEASVGLPEDMTAITDPERIKIIEDFIHWEDETLLETPNDVSIWRRKGLYLWQLGRVGEAMACFEKMIEIEPDNAQIYYDKLALLLFMEKYAEAFLCVEEMSGLAWIDQGPVCFIKGFLFETLGKNDEATMYYNKAKEAMGTDFPNAWEFKGMLAASQGRNKDALGYIENAIIELPTRWELWIYKGELLQRMGKNGKAKGSYKKAQELKQNQE